MQRILLAGAVFIAAMALEQRPAHANDRAPWCAVFSIGTGDIIWDCQYRTFEECYPNVISGNRGFCNHNPRYEASVVVPRAHAKRRVKQH
jgi:Protein of unknown function (DUF3551)